MDWNKPDPFTPKKNQIGKDWRVWKEGFLIYLKLSGGYENYTEEDRALLLLNLMGSEAIKAMGSIVFDHPNEKNDMDILLMKFDEIFDPPPNEILERYKFFSRTKGAKEDIENYVAVLKEQATKCNFGPQTEKLIIDMIIKSMNKEYQEKMFEIEDITLPDIIQHYKRYIINTEQMEELSKNIMKTLSSTNPEDVADMSKVKQKKSRNCSRCGTQHVQKSCPADGNICGVCNEKNHFDKFCTKMTTNNGKSEEWKSKPNCSKCRMYHPFKQCPAYNETCKSEEWKSRPVCSKCGTNHPFKQCPAYNGAGKNEEGKSKPICLMCGTYHPFRRCPAYNETGKNEEGKYKPICSKCGTNHPFKQCPAFDEVCLKCDTKGHFTSKCKQKETIKQTSIGINDSEKKSETSNSTNKEDVEHKSVVNELEDCQWCGSRHVRGKCLHDANCTTCDKFPHNICFQCRMNPHDNTCYYKSILSLPQVVPPLNNRFKPDIPTCFRCGTNHVAAACPVPRNDKCYRCNNFGHFTEECPLYKNTFTNRQNVNPGANTVDPILQDFVTVRSKEKLNTTYFDKGQEKNSNQRANSSQFSKTNKRSEKPDSCTIS